MAIAAKSRSGRAAVALATGAAAGLIVATVALWAWAWLADLAPNRNGAAKATVEVREVADAVDVFRLPSGGAREMILVRVGPDGAGESRLTADLFPGETPPREVLAVVFANVSATDAWDVDLSGDSLRARCDAGWESIEPVASASPALAGGGIGLPSPSELRARSLGATATSVHLEPGALRQVLVALPKARKMSDLADVQWGEVTLVRDQFDLERLRRFRTDAALSTAPSTSPRR